MKGDITDGRFEIITKFKTDYRLKGYIKMVLEL